MIMMSAAHVDDFFSAWLADEDNEGSGELFDPDENWGIIFDIP